MNEEWILHNKQADFSGLSAKYNIPTLLVKLMINRGVREEDFTAYLGGGLENMPDAFRMKDLVKAADMLMEIAGRGEYAAIVSDYDCDGVFSGMILYTGLKRIGANPVIYTPDRVTEGYGINRRIIDEIYNRGMNYIITCDNGIAAYDEITYAKSLGMKVIITDHHEVPYTDENGVKVYRVPAADAVCNPKQEDCDYPYKGLCGGGVAYKLIGYIYDSMGIPESEKHVLLEYAAIATVADIMELTGENRIIVREGLKRIGKSRSAGIRAIKTVNGLDDKAVGAYHIGFVIGPCFNAAGRIETAKTAFDLLMCTDDSQAITLAYRLKDLNDERKNMTEAAAERGLMTALSPAYEHDKVVVMILDGCHESIAGIVAGRIKDRLCKPVIVFTEVEDGMCKGSGRSIQNYNMYEELSNHAHLYERYGGHAMAAGITLKKENVGELRVKLNERCTLTDKDFVSKVYIDAEVLFRHMTEDIVKALGMLEPCGNGNKKPLFVVRHAGVRGARIFGKNGNVLKLTLVDGVGNVLYGIGFNIVEEFFDMIEREYGRAQKENMLQGRACNIDVSFTFYPEINEYNGRKNIQLVIQNFKVIGRMQP
ncbi:MAG: single-stranded-DNA-specific exonuclease RecJ [Lachnospiraceae bacterium]|nr:single-stranded-DNA-specific exonuclease RecJ [Lachnospiraceae bacterium]